MLSPRSPTRHTRGAGHVSTPDSAVRPDRKKTSTHQSAHCIISTASSSIVSQRQGHAGWDQDVESCLRKNLSYLKPEIYRIRRRQQPPRPSHDNSSAKHVVRSRRLDHFLPPALLLAVFP